MGVRLTREQLQALMMRLHEIPPDKRIAMLGRMKHFQRLGWPPGSNLGKGQRVRYDPYQVALLGLALEMIQLGLTPERVVETLQDQFEETLAVITYDHEHAEKPARLIFDPAALSTALGAGEPKKERDAEEGIELEKWGRRMAIINLTMLLDEIDATLAQLGFTRPGDFRRDLGQAAQELHELAHA